MARNALASVVIALVSLGYAVPGAALRCGDELVKEGDYAFEIREACGAPTAVDRKPAPADHHRRDQQVRAERWYYDLGDNRLLRVFHLRDGRLRRIETRDHGLGEESAADGCDPRDIQRGMSSYRLLRRCGAPVQRERRAVEPASADGSTHRHKGVVWQEEWIYTFDDRYIARRVRLLAGVVESVDTVP